MEISNAYFKKNVSYRYREIDLNFKVSQDLFGSLQIDHGTHHLLQTLSENIINNSQKIMDFGCGYGPIGIALKRCNPESTVHMVDRDALALRFSQENAASNDISDIHIYGSLGYDSISDNNFDLIVSNIPAKIGKKALTHILIGARRILKQNGIVAIVVIDAIVDYVKKTLETHSDVKIIFQKTWPGYTVFHYQFTSAPLPKNESEKSAFDEGIFDREDRTFTYKDSHYRMITTYDLPEFDTLSFETKLLLSTLMQMKKQPTGTVYAYNVGQGHVPIVCSLQMKVDKFYLVDRDLLALNTTKRNLILNRYSQNNIQVFHQVGILSQESSAQSDYILGILPEKELPEVNILQLTQAVQLIRQNGIIMLAGDSTPITRLKDYVNKTKMLRVVLRNKNKGKSALVMTSK